MDYMVNFGVVQISMTYPLDYNALISVIRSIAWTVYGKFWLDKTVIIMSPILTVFKYLLLSRTMNHPKSCIPRFDVTPNICLAINNIDYVLEFIKPFVTGPVPILAVCCWGFDCEGRLAECMVARWLQPNFKIVCVWPFGL